MYAIIKTGGKQYRVKEGDVIDVELLGHENNAKIELSEVLFVFDGSKSHVGAPFVSNFLVHAEVVDEVKGEKVRGLKYTPREHSRHRWGHRQRYTRLKITKLGNKKD